MLRAARVLATISAYHGAEVMVDFAVVPERTALVNVDMQNCFVQSSPFSAPDGPVVLGRINRLAAACRAAGILVIHASHVLRTERNSRCFAALSMTDTLFQQPASLA